MKRVGNGRLRLSSALVPALFLLSLGSDLSPAKADSPLDRSELISTSSQGVQGNESSDRSDISADGRFVAFTSRASNLVIDDHNNATDVFVRDRETRTTERVSISSSGSEATLGPSAYPGISPNGRYVVFTSSARGLTPHIANGFEQVFLRDRELGLTTLVTESLSGTVGNGFSNWPAVSDDGVVAFRSDATDLVTGDSNGVGDVFVRDLDSGITMRVSVSSSGQQANGSSGPPDITPDGRHIVFGSSASNLVVGDTNAQADVFLRDRWATETTVVTRSFTGGPTDGRSLEPAITADGRYVAYTSYATNITQGYSGHRCGSSLGSGGQPCPDIYVTDMLTETTTWVSVSELGVKGDALNLEAAISDDGRYVSFTSSNAFMHWCQGGTFTVYVRDLQERRTECISTDWYGLLGEGLGGSISADGRYVAFDSRSELIAIGDTNRHADVFVRDRLALR
jgi:Tol biopolymer transport system component